MKKIGCFTFILFLILAFLQSSCGVKISRQGLEFVSLPELMCESKCTMLQPYCFNFYIDESEKPRLSEIDTSVHRWVSGRITGNINGAFIIRECFLSNMEVFREDMGVSFNAKFSVRIGNDNAGAGNTGFSSECIDQNETEISFDEFEFHGNLLDNPAFLAVKLWAMSKIMSEIQRAIEMEVFRAYSAGMPRNNIYCDANQTTSSNPPADCGCN